MFDIKIAVQKGKELFSLLEKHSHLKYLIEDDVITTDFFDYLQENDISYNSGCSRYVFWFNEDKDYVFKIPMRGEEIYGTAEEKNYLKACEEGVDFFFAPCAKVFEYCNRPVYAMEFALVDNDTLTEDLFEKLSQTKSEEEVEEEMYNMDGLEETVTLMEYYYPYSKIKQFYNFCDKNFINDLHELNVGYINDRLVVIDYAGYGVL